MLEFDEEMKEAHRLAWKVWKIQGELKRVDVYRALSLLIPARHVVDVYNAMVEHLFLREEGNKVVLLSVGFV